MSARDRLRSSVSLSISVVLLSAAGNAFAWDFKEHEAFGDQGFVQACTQAQEDAKKRAPTDAAAIAAMLQNGQTCSTVVLAARRSYGELAALAGDIIDSPYVFTDRPSELEGR